MTTLADTSTPSDRLATILPHELHAQLRDGREIALLDAREPGIAQREETLLVAVSVPASTLELRVAALVPRPSTRIVVIDGHDDGIAEHVAVRLIELGYTDVSTLAGGVDAWRSAGYVTYSGVSSLGQAFGEFVEAEYGTPHLSAATLKQLLDEGGDVVVLDSRPMPEYTARSIPGAIAAPGAELVYRAREQVPSPSTTIVVNCAGRTRSILGAQALINAGLPNPIFALENGTMAWSLAGFPFAFGDTQHAPSPSIPSLAAANESASRIADRFAVTTIDHDTLARFDAEGDERSVYLLDVRTPEEYAEGHLSGSRSTPSWELAPWVFRHVGTRNARLVLVDDGDGVRATVTASWLNQIGWGEVFVLADALVGHPLETGPEPVVVLGAVPIADSISVEQLAARLISADDTAVVDAGNSTRYEDRHIPGAWFAVRSRLAETIGGLPGTGTIVVTADHDALAHLVAADLRRLTAREVVVLAGGLDAWAGAGNPVEAGRANLLDETIDVAETAWRSRGDRHEAFRNYLSWEVALRDQVSFDETSPFRAYPPTTSPASASSTR